MKQQHPRAFKDIFLQAPNSELKTIMLERCKEPLAKKLYTTQEQFNSLCNYLNWLAPITYKDVPEADRNYYLLFDKGDKTNVYKRKLDQVLTVLYNGDREYFTSIGSRGVGTGKAPAGMSDEERAEFYSPMTKPSSMGIDKVTFLRNYNYMVVDVDAKRQPLSPEEFRHFIPKLVHDMEHHLRIELLPHALVYTGAGLQLYVRFEYFACNGKSSEQKEFLNNMNKKLQEEYARFFEEMKEPSDNDLLGEDPIYSRLSVDTGISLAHQKVRIPGSYHARTKRTGLFVDLENTDVYALSDMFPWNFGGKKPSKSRMIVRNHVMSVDFHFEKRMEAMTSVFEKRGKDVTKDFSRQNMFANVGVLHAHVGRSLEEAIEAGLSLNEYFEYYPFTTKEVRDAIRHGYTYGSRRPLISNRSMSDFLGLTNDESKGTIFHHSHRTSDSAASLLKAQKARTARAKKDKAILTGFEAGAKEAHSFTSLARQLDTTPAYMEKLVLGKLRELVLEYSYSCSHHGASSKKAQKAHAALASFSRLYITTSLSDLLAPKECGFSAYPDMASLPFEEAVAMTHEVFVAFAGRENGSAGVFVPLKDIVERLEVLVYLSGASGAWEYIEEALAYPDPIEGYFSKDRKYALIS